MDNVKQPQPTPTGTDDRLLRLEELAAVQGQRIEQLEQLNADLKQLIRNEAMRLLGMTLGTVGEQLLLGATAKHTYMVQECNDEHPINSDTFYARRVGTEWLTHMVREDHETHTQHNVAVELTKLPPNMATQIKSFLAALPAGVSALAFNVYRSE